MSKPGKKFRRNVRELKDADYKDKLDSKDKQWLEQFEAEYYSNDLNKEGSIHKQELLDKTYICSNCSKEDNAFDLAKKETFGATNAQNRDAYAIAGTGNCLDSIEDPAFYKELLEPLKHLTDIVDPSHAYDIFLERTIEEIEDDSRELEAILTEFATEMVKLGSSLSRRRVNTILKNRADRKAIREAKKNAK